jgi:hypothetical protein
MCLIFLRQHYLVQVDGYILSIRFFLFSGGSTPLVSSLLTGCKVTNKFDNRKICVDFYYICVLLSFFFLIFAVGLLLFAVLTV